MIKMDYNYHTHTFRCSHATGTEEEYIKRAIENGIRYMGFSDHAPFRFPDGSEQYYRVPTSLVADYFNTLRRLREKYADRLDLKIGFEMEYYPEYFDSMLDLAQKSGAEYLILGQHHVYDPPKAIPSTKPTDDPLMLRWFVDTTVEAMKTGVFSYVAHPDVLSFVGDEELYKKEMLRICEASKRLNLPLEINFLGIRDGRFYPHMSFWELVGNVGAPVTFGFDAHDAQAAFDRESLDKAMEIVKRFGLNYIGKPTLKEI